MPADADTARSILDRQPSSLFPRPPAGQLPSGRHGLPRDYVLTNQRERIDSAVMRAVAECGYAAATVGDISTAARLSRRTFYEHFEGKEDCFLEAYANTMDAAMYGTKEAIQTAESFPTGVRTILERMVMAVHEHPLLAQACLVEIGAVGPAGVRKRDEAMGRFASLLRGHGSRVVSRPVPAMSAELVVSGLHQVMAARLAQDRTAELKGELDEMVFCALAPFYPADQARKLSGLAADS